MLKLKNQKGFTLIELLVTIALIGIIGVPLLGLLSASMQNNAHSRSKTSTGTVAQNFMEFYKSEAANTLMAGKSQGETVHLYLLYKIGNTIPGTLPGISGPANYKKYNSDITTYDGVISAFGNPDMTTYDYVVKAVLTVKDTNLIQINVVVWDKMYKDSSKVNLISLRSF